MLTQLDFLRLTEKYHDNRLVHIIFSATEFVFRTLTRKELRIIQSSGGSKEDIEDMICQQALVYPDNYDFFEDGFAGIPEKMSGVIIDLSHLGDPTSLIDLYDRSKESLQTVESQCMIMIKAAMPEIKFSEMQAWDWSKLIRYTAISEQILSVKAMSNRGEVVSLEFTKEQAQEAIESVEQFDPEFIKELRNSGTDPMLYYGPAIVKNKPLRDEPFTGSTLWYDEGMIDAISRQISAGRHPR